MHFFFSVAHCVLNTSLKTCMFAINILMWNLKKQTNIIITMIIVIIIIKGNKAKMGVTASSLSSRSFASSVHPG